MSPLYIYGLVRDPGERPLGAGLRGEPLRALKVGTFWAMAGAMDDLPPLEPASLLGHDAVVRRLAAASDAVLPARYGSVVADVEALGRALAPRAADLMEALVLVQGREQMTLRVFGEPAPSPDPMLEAEERGSGPGARYLRRRREADLRERRLDEIAPLRPALQPLVRAERIERREHARPYLASVYHLVDRGAGGEYVAAVRAAAATLRAVRVAPSGPWPPYAFAPDGVP